MKSVLATLVLVAASGVLVNCSSSSGDNAAGGNPPNPHRLDWGKVSSAYSPTTEKIPLDLTNIQQVRVDAFGFKDDAEVVYDSSLDSTHGYLTVYEVEKDQEPGVSGSLNTSSENGTLKVYGEGSYSCRIEIKDGVITNLKGRCYVRLQVVLPAGAQIEAYNVGQILTKHFFAMTNQTMLTNLREATFDDKKKVISDYLNSYAAVGTSPSLTTVELGEVLDAFPFTDDKLSALSSLQGYSSDRGNLSKLLDSKFTAPWDRDKARQICGV